MMRCHVVSLLIAAAQVGAMGGWKAAPCLALALAVGAVCCPGADDLVLSNRFGEVTAGLFLPGDVPRLRGLYVHAANYKLAPDDRWAESGRVIGFGHLAVDIDRRANNRPAKLRQALDEALAEFAGKSGHPELPHLPLAGAGHSAGGWVIQILLKTPERAISAAIDCAWVADTAKLNPRDKAVPLLFTLGAIPDDFKMLPDITNKYAPARLDGWLWGLGIQHGCAHDFGNTAALALPWLNAVIEARLPRDASALSGPPPLRDLRLEDGWLGDYTRVEGTWATIAAYADYPGDRSRAAWFPNRAIAMIWRAWQTKDSPVTLTAESADGAAQLPAWTPKTARDLMVNPGVSIHLGARVKEGLAARQIQFYAGDQLLGTARAAPWRFTWENPPPGAHGVHAIWETLDGQKGAVNPALVICRKKRHRP